MSSQSMSGLTIPSSDSIVEVKAIDGGLLSLPASLFFSPVLRGYEDLIMLSFVFSIENKAKGRRVLFDLGLAKDQRYMTPPFLQSAKEWGLKVVVEKDVATQLKEQGVDLEKIDAVIWSHAHFDHFGDITTFPNSTDVVFGEGTKGRFFPPYPGNPESSLHENYFIDRNVTEISFKDSTLNIGGFRAHDYFGDGSFYLMDAPGHVPGHIVGLARTTPTTFILMGGDTCHHPALFRPSANIREYFPCPASLMSSSISHEYFVSEGENVDDLRRPLLEPNAIMHEDIHTAIGTMTRMSEVFDAHPDVLIILAHDTSILQRSEFFPESLNDWKEKNIKEKRIWNFLDKENDAFRFKPKD